MLNTSMKNNSTKTVKAYDFGMLIEVRYFAWNLADLHDINNIATPGHLEPGYGRLRC